MKLITHSMHWGWKLSFVALVTWLAVTAVGAFVGDEELLVFGMVPMAIWFAARWIAIGNPAQQGG